MTSDQKMVALGDIAEHVTVGHVGPTSQYYCSDGIPFLRTQNVGSGQVLLDDVKHITPEFHERLKKSNLRTGDLLISRVISSEIRTAIVPATLDGANCANIIVVRPGKHVHSPYLLHFISSPLIQQRMMQRKVGSAQSVVNTGLVKGWELPLPPMEEQRRIADILDKADAIRRKRQQAIALTESLLRSAFLEMFGDPVGNPKGWPVVAIGDVVTKTQYGTADKANEEGRGQPVLRMNNITYGGEIDTNHIKWCELSNKDLEKFTVRKGDLLFNRTNSPELVGKTAVWDRNDRYAFAGYLVRARFDESRMLPNFASGFLNSAYGKRYIFAKAKPSNNMSNFSAGEFVKIPIPLPPVGRQREYEAVLGATRRTQRRLREAASQDETLFNALVQRAFRGELSV